jgi:hypothetical protein
LPNGAFEVPLTPTLTTLGPRIFATSSAGLGSPSEAGGRVDVLLASVVGDVPPVLPDAVVAVG